jgi:alpha-beta hydrolase superfamily lysophospholipase
VQFNDSGHTWNILLFASLPAVKCMQLEEKLHYSEGYWTMEHIEGSFNHEGVGNLYYQGWLPEGEPRAVLLILHGLAEHGGRYLNVVNQLVPAGFAVYAIDHYGHGRSEGPRTFVPCFEYFTEPLKTFLDRVKELQPGKKVFLFGHSMGGLIAAKFLLSYQDELGGAVISAPLVKIPEVVTASTIFLARTVSAIAPKLRLQGVPAEGVSRDPAVVEAYDNDPLNYRGKTTARLSSELLNNLKEIQGKEPWITLPVQVLQGGNDILIDPKGAEDFYHALGSEDKEHHEYDGYYHEIFNDLGKEIPLGDMQAWLEAHL